MAECLDLTTLSNALSKSSRSSEAPIFFAVSTKRLWRSASVSFGLAGRFIGSLSRSGDKGRSLYSSTSQKARSRILAQFRQRCRSRLLCARQNGFLRLTRSLLSRIHQSMLSHNSPFLETRAMLRNFAALGRLKKQFPDTRRVLARRLRQ
jgi:hypothetical protein